MDKLNIGDQRIKNYTVDSSRCWLTFKINMGNKKFMKYWLYQQLVLGKHIKAYILYGSNDVIESTTKLIKKCIDKSSIPHLSARYKQKQDDLYEAGRLYFEWPIANVLKQKILFTNRIDNRTSCNYPLTLGRSKTHQLTQIPKLQKFFPRVTTKSKIRNRNAKTLKKIQ